MNLPPFFWVIIAIVIISTIVGAVAKLLNNMNEQNNAPRNRPPARANGPGGGGAGGGGGGGVVRQSSSDMDRFLAEIDRLRKKNAEAPPPQPGQPAPVAPVVQPAKQPDKPRPRVVAELAEPPRQDPGFTAPPPLPTAPPPLPTGPKAGDLPVAAVVTPPSSAGTGAPAATRVTKLATRPRPAAKTPFAKNLTTILNSGQGLALAVVLQEVLGPPRSKRE
jgi:hypothetical protein